MQPIEFVKLISYALPHCGIRKLQEAAPIDGQHYYQNVSGLAAQSLFGCRVAEGGQPPDTARHSRKLHMPDRDLSHVAVGLHQFVMTAVLFGPVRPDQNLHRQTQRALKSNTAGHDFFTDITLHESHQPGSMRIEYTVTAMSPSSAERAGAVYLSQLCDLLSTTIRSPIRFFLPDENVREERFRTNRKATSLDRVLTENEWHWIIGSLVYLRREHPRYLAAASWYRKGLIGSDVLENFCCFWRVIERIALSYADKSKLDDRDRGRTKPCVAQLVAELFNDKVPESLSEDIRVGEIIQLRNDLSHGNVPITSEVIDQANGHLKPLEQAAFEVLERIRNSRISINPLE